MSEEQNIRYLGEQLRLLRQEVKLLRAQASLNKLANSSLYQALSNTPIQAPTIRNPTIEGTASGGTWTNVNNISTDRVTIVNDDDGDDVELTAAGATTVLTCPVDFELSAGKTVTAPNLKATTQIEVNNADGDNPTITASGAGAAAGIVTNKNFTCVNGIFGANTVKVGTQLISDDTGLKIASSDPFIYLKDDDNAFPNNDSLIALMDSGNNITAAFQQYGAATYALLGTQGADNELHLGTYNEATDPPIYFLSGGVKQLKITDGTLEPETDNDIDLGAAAKEFKDLFLDGTAHIDTLDVDETATITTSLQLAGGAVITTLGDTAALADSDVKIPTNTTVKEYADKKLEADDSSYVHRVSAPFANRNDSSNGSNITSGSSGTYLVTTGTGYLLFVLEPPEWMIKYAADNSLTITVTTITVNWDNTVSADYITQFRVWHSDYNSATATALINDTTNYGQGSTGFRNDVFNITDKTLVAGEWLTVLINTVQGTAYSERIVSFETTYTMT